MTSGVMVTPQIWREGYLMTTTHPTSMGIPSTKSTTNSAISDAAGKYVSWRGTRRFLLADAALTGVNGLAYVVLPGILGEAFGISSGLLVGLGIFLLVVAAEIVFLATRNQIPRFWVTVLAEVNALWVVASLVFAAVAGLTTLGVVWVIAQAVIVGAFAVRQLMIAKA